MSQGAEQLYMLAFTQAQIPSISFSIAHAYFRISFLCNIGTVEFNSDKITLLNVLHVQEISYWYFLHRVCLTKGRTEFYIPTNALLYTSTIIY